MLCVWLIWLEKLVSLTEMTVSKIVCIHVYDIVMSAYLLSYMIFHCSMIIMPVLFYTDRRKIRLPVMAVHVVVGRTVCSPLNKGICN